MVKKLTLGVAMTAVAGLVTSLAAGGCSSSSEPSAGGSTQDGGGGDVKTVPTDDGGGDQCPKSEPAITRADLDKDPGWKEPIVTAGACSAADLDTFEMNLNDTTLTFGDLGKGIGDACKACILSKDTDASWQIIVTSAADGGQTGFVNFGACIASIDGEACGRSAQYEQLCYQIACNACTKDSAEFQACAKKAASGVCAAIADQTSKDCPNLQKSAPRCNNALNGARTMCGGGANDGGAD